MSRALCFALVAVLLLVPDTMLAGSVSAASEECLACHEEVTPGIVGDWRRSRHAKTTVAQALAEPVAHRRVSVAEKPGERGDVVVGCAECHLSDPESHADTWDHEGYPVHSVVTPRDCALCHPVEAEQYGENMMSRAYGNLVDNPVFADLQMKTNGIPTFAGGAMRIGQAGTATEAESCLACHGTKVEVTGLTTKGDIEVPALSGWPNQGVGRINPDGSRGSCSSCHPRHEFSIAMARKPETCSQCHKGPDTPAFKVYEVSKHGNIYKARGGTWDFDAVPWTLGEDFTSPTCSTCHISGATDPSGNVIATRSHSMKERLPWRLFGLPFAHPHPEGADTTILRNDEGLPLPTSLDGTPASVGLVSVEELGARRDTMKGVCQGCHSSQWTDNHFDRLEGVIAETNARTLATTRMMEQAWAMDVAHGFRKGDSLFNEHVERLWVNSWLLYANSTRISAAMAGAEYSVFGGGRWQGSNNALTMHQFLRDHGAVVPPPPPGY